MDKLFTAEKVKDLRQELNKAIASFAAKNGLEVHFGDAKFDPITATFQVKVTHLPSEDFDPIQALWEVHCGRIGFAPEDMGKEFSFYGYPERYRLIGYNPNAKSNSLVILRLRDKKKFSATPENVYNAIYGPQNPAPMQDAGALRAKKIWDASCWRSDLKPEDFGKTIYLNGEFCVIVGYDNASRSKTILVKSLEREEVFAASSRDVKKALEKAIV